MRTVHVNIRRHPIYRRSRRRGVLVFTQPSTSTQKAHLRYKAVTLPHCYRLFNQSPVPPIPDM